MLPENRWEHLFLNKENVEILKNMVCMLGIEVELNGPGVQTYEGLRIGGGPV